MRTKSTKPRGGYDKEFYNTPIYQSWFNMKTRCTNKKSPDYKRYGGRGILVTPEWYSFKNFLIDMLPTYQVGLTIDRIDNNKGYSKENCRLATAKEQANNTRNIERAKKYEYKGVRKRVSEWAKEFGIKRTTLDMRLRNYKWSIIKSLTYKIK